MRIRQAAVEFLQFLQDLRRPLVIERAVGRYHDATGGAVEERRLQMPFERLDHVGHGRLRHVERRGGAGEIARLDHADENPHC